MQNSLFQAICRMGIFMICVRAIIQFRPNEAYEKYLRLLAGIMIMIQLFLPVGKLILGRSGQEAAEILEQFRRELEQGMEEAVESAGAADALLEQMTLEEVQRRLEEAQGSENVPGDNAAGDGENVSEEGAVLDRENALEGDMDQDKENAVEGGAGWDGENAVEGGAGRDRENAVEGSAGRERKDAVEGDMGRDRENVVEGGSGRDYDNDRENGGSLDRENAQGTIVTGADEADTAIQIEEIEPVVIELFR